MKSAAGNTKSYSPPLNSENAAVDDEEDGAWAVSVPEDELAASVATEAPAACITLLDLGSTCYMSTYCADFTNLCELPARTFQAANKQCFSAVGSGDLIISLLNGSTTSQLTLQDVLYAPDIGYTLVSVGKLNALGYCIVFEDSICRISSPAGIAIGMIQKSACGLYCAIGDQDSPVEEAEEDSTAAIVPKLTIIKLHWRLRNIAPTAAKKLVENGLVKGITMRQEGNNITFCDSCMYARASQKPMPKACNNEDCAKVFGEEIHSDMWGPTPVQMLRDHQYYVSFTDDFS
jgi:hypothetical protein